MSSGYFYHGTKLRLNIQALKAQGQCFLLWWSSCHFKYVQKAWWLLVETVFDISGTPYRKAGALYGISVRSGS